MIDAERAQVRSQIAAIRHQRLRLAELRNETPEQRLIFMQQRAVLLQLVMELKQQLKHQWHIWAGATSKDNP